MKVKNRGRDARKKEMRSIAERIKTSSGKRRIKEKCEKEEV